MRHGVHTSARHHHASSPLPQKIVFQQPMTVLVGQNGCGKTVRAGGRQHQRPLRVARARRPVADHHRVPEVHEHGFPSPWQRQRALLCARRACEAGAHARNAGATQGGCLPHRAQLTGNSVVKASIKMRMATSEQKITVMRNMQVSACWRCRRRPFECAARRLAADGVPWRQAAVQSTARQCVPASGQGACLSAYCHALPRAVRSAVARRSLATRARRCRPAAAWTKRCQRS